MKMLIKVPSKTTVPLRRYNTMLSFKEFFYGQTYDPYAAFPIAQIDEPMQGVGNATSMARTLMLRHGIEFHALKKMTDMVSRISGATHVTNPQDFFKGPIPAQTAGAIYNVACADIMHSPGTYHQLMQMEELKYLIDVKIVNPQSLNGQGKWFNTQTNKLEDMSTLTQYVQDPETLRRFQMDIRWIDVRQVHMLNVKWQTKRNFGDTLAKGLDKAAGTAWSAASRSNNGYALNKSITGGI